MNVVGLAGLGGGIVFLVAVVAAGTDSNQCKEQTFSTYIGFHSQS